MVLSLLKLDGVERVLEVGCGDAYQSGLWARKVAEVVPTDITTERMKRKIPDFVQSSASHLPFKANSFDIIFSSHVLEHIADRKNFIWEQKRVCKGEGVIVIVVPTAFWKSMQLLTHYLGFVYRGPLEFAILFLRSRIAVEKHRIMAQILSRILPLIDGEFKSHAQELLFYRKESWVRLLHLFNVGEMRVIPTFPFGSLSFTVIPRAHLFWWPSSSFIFLIKRKSLKTYMCN